MKPLQKTRKKAGMISSGCTDRKNTNPLIYIKLWKQACLPTLLFGSELCILSQTQVLQLERCQRWFLRKVFHLPKFCDSIILTKISGLWSVESAVNYRKLLFFARTINRSPKDNVYQLLLLRIDNFLNHPDRSTGFIKDNTEICKKYDLFDLFLSWATENHAMSYGEWKCTLRNRISIFENSLWKTYTENQ